MMSSVVDYWLEISVRVDGEAAEAVSAALEPYAYQGSVVLEQQGDPNNPDPKAMLDDVLVKIYVPDYQDTPETRRKIEETLYFHGLLYPIPAPHYLKIRDEDWSTAWRKNYHPFRIGRRTRIRPSWLEIGEHDAGDLIITLDPGMAFGTGLHPSTQMCVEYLESLVRPGFDVLDIGTGSGILAIASVGYGARRVLAFDTDGVAVRTAKENARLNNGSDRIDLFQGTLANLGPFKWDIVVVNILAPVIEKLLRDDLFSFLKDDGRLVLSGIIAQQSAGVQSTILETGGKMEATRQIGDWVSISAKKKSAIP
ncbi:MAG: 50S ribosomal protein L11 methyltransferase [Candidatus Promineifilaceae bacterium]